MIIIALMMRIASWKMIMKIQKLNFTYVSEGAPESDKLSDTPDITDEMISSDEDGIFESQSVLQPMITESKTNASPLAKLYEPSLVKERNSDTLNEGLASCCTTEKPTHHNDSQKAPIRSQRYVHTDDQEKVTYHALGIGASNEVTVRCFGIVLQRSDLQLLNDFEWLNDQVTTH